MIRLNSTVWKELEFIVYIWRNIFAEMSSYISMKLKFDEYINFSNMCYMKIQSWKL